MKDRYLFPSKFIYESSGISIIFPDLDGCVSFGESEEQAFFNAREALTLHLYGMEKDNDEIPAPTSVNDIKLEPNEHFYLIDVDMKAYRAKKSNRIVKKTVTIPEWLNYQSEVLNLNFSQILQQGLIKNIELMQRIK